jgi:hypothetical protein
MGCDYADCTANTSRIASKNAIQKPGINAAAKSLPSTDENHRNALVILFAQNWIGIDVDFSYDQAVRFKECFCFIAQAATAAGIQNRVEHQCYLRLLENAGLQLSLA